MLYAMLGLCAAILAFDLIICLKRGLYKSLVRVGTQIASAAAAFFTAKPVAAKVTDKLMPWIEARLFANPTVASYFEQNPNAEQVFSSFGGVLAAPLIFLILYIVYKLLTLILYRVLVGIFDITGPKNGLARGLGALLMGILSGLIGIFVLCTPVLGYATLGDAAINEYEDAPEAIVRVDRSHLRPTKNAPGLSVMQNMIGAKAFTRLTTVKTDDGTEVTLENEVTSAVTMVNKVRTMAGKSVEEYTTADIAKFRDASVTLGDSVLLSEVAGLAMHTLGESWLNGEPVFGLSCPEMSNDAKVVTNGLLRVFADTNGKTVSKNLVSLADIMGEVATADAFRYLSADADPQDFARALQTAGTIDHINAILAENPAMQPIADAIYDIAMRAMVRQIGADVAAYRETHPELMSDVANALRDSAASGEINTETLTTLLETAVTDSGYEVSEEAINMIANGFAESFADEDLTDLTDDEIIDLVIARLTEATEVELGE